MVVSTFLPAALFQHRNPTRQSATNSHIYLHSDGAASDDGRKTGTSSPETSSFSNRPSPESGYNNGLAQKTGLYKAIIMPFLFYLTNQLLHPKVAASE
jgi:hypothetical protein